MSGVVCTVIQASSGSDFRITCIAAASWACHRPSARPSPGSRHSRRRRPWLASSLALSASPASVAATALAGVPAGMEMVKAVKNSVAPAVGGSAGSFGCGASGVTSSVRHTRSGIEARISSSRSASAAAKSPSERHSPGCSGGRHSRSRCPCAASSPERAASRARMASTACSGVPSGTWVVMVTRYSMMSASRSAECDVGDVDGDVDGDRARVRGRGAARRRTQTRRWGYVIHGSTCWPPSMS